MEDNSTKNLNQNNGQVTPQNQNSVSAPSGGEKIFDAQKVVSPNLNNGASVSAGAPTSLNSTGATQGVSGAHAVAGANGAQNVAQGVSNNLNGVASSNNVVLLLKKKKAE